MARQGHLIETVAINQLNARRERLVAMEVDGIPPLVLDSSALNEQLWRVRLTHKVRLGMTANEMGSQLREIAPDVRRAGYIVKFGKSNGNRFIELRRDAA